MRFEPILCLIFPLFISGCSERTGVPQVYAETPVVLHLSMQSSQFPEVEIKLSNGSAIGFQSIVEKMAQKGRPHTAITKTPLGIFVVGDHEFRWRGSILYYLQ